MPGTEFVSSEGHLSIASFFGADDVRPRCDVVLKTGSEDGAFEELYERFVEPDLIREGLLSTRSHMPHIPLT